MTTSKARWKIGGCAMNRSISQAIQMIAQAIGENPDPQDLVDMLHQKMCGPHISTCSLMFYGPLREDRPNGPFDYLEVSGSGRNGQAAATAQGIKIYLEQYPDFIQQLEEQRDHRGH